MGIQNIKKRRLKVGTLNVEIYPSGKAAGETAARAAADALHQLDRIMENIGVIFFATGASHLDTLHALIPMHDLPWNKVRGFHLDE